MRQDEIMESGPMDVICPKEVTVMEPFGSGTTSLTYKVLRNNRYLLLKQLRPEFASKAFYRDALRKEYETGLRLDSPFLPHYETCNDVVADGLLLEYIQGSTLEEILATKPEYLAEKQRLMHLTEQLLTGLSHLHAQRVVHLDIKPSNIIIDQVNGHLHIIDLGFCYTDAMPFTIGMTDAFAAPEQQEGKKVDARTDLYAVGKLLEHIQEQTHQKFPHSLRKLMKRCLQACPDNRYQSAQEALNELTAKHGGRTLLSFLALMGIVAIVAAMAWPASEEHKTVSRLPYDFYVKNVLNTEPIYYHILSEDSAWVEVTYKRKTGNDYNDDLSISPTVTYEGKEYTIVAIGDSAFNHCKQLRGISLPETIRKIGARAFNDCPQLQTITMPDGIHSIGTFAFGSCKSLTRIHIPDALTTITEGCFFDTDLREVTIPEGVTSIMRDAFCGCNSLEKVRLPETLEKLSRGVFYHCVKLTSITLPQNLQSIGEYCFDECSSLLDVHLLSPIPPKATTIFPEPFQGTIHVPEGSKILYKEAECWDNYDIK